MTITKLLFAGATTLGAATIAWMGAGFLGTDALAFVVTAIIGAAYFIGVLELFHFRQATASLSAALASLPAAPADTGPEPGTWVKQLHPSLQNPVQSRIEGEAVPLPAPVITPYLVGLLVMLGLLGTFVGMVDTLQGAVAALQGNTELSAIRNGLAAPIAGLGVAFGTSVAGIAASAMLGLASTLSRRERLLAGRQLESQIGSHFRQHSLIYQRQQTYSALQQQADTLPAVAEQLQSLAGSLERMGEQLTNTLIANQEQFHDSASAAYKDLANSVEQTLNSSLSESGRLAGESLRPHVEAAMAGIGQQAENTHRQLADTAKNQLDAVSTRLASTVGEITSTIAAADEQRLQHFSDSLASKQQQTEAQLARAAQTFSEDIGTLTSAQNSAIEALTQTQQEAITAAYEAQQSAINSAIQNQEQALSGVIESQQAALTSAGEAQQANLDSATKAFTALVEQLTQQWQQAGEQTQALQSNAVESQQRAIEAASEAQKSTLAAATEEFAKLAGELNQQWQQSGEQTQALQGEVATSVSAAAQQLQQEFTALREGEQARNDQTIERLAELQSTVAENLAALGQGLEAPMTSLIETASEAPQAAAQVITRLQEEIANNTERDNKLLQERREVLEDLHALSGSLQAASSEQREAVAELVNSSAAVLQEVGVGFGDHVASQGNTLTEISANFAGSAAEIASLGEAFTLAVQLFNESNQGLTENLARIESALDSAGARSDEQMAYYVAQAREIIDQSMFSQREIIEELRQLGRTEDLFDSSAQKQSEEQAPAQAEAG